MLEKGYSILHEGKPVLIFGTCLVDVVKEYDTIVSVYEWPGNDPDNWRKLHLHSKTHEVVWFSTGKDEKYIIDFTAPSYGIYEFNTDGKPLYFTHYDKQQDYVIKSLGFPDDVDKVLTEQIQKENKKPSGETVDWRPLMTLGAKETIVLRATLE
jgi:hypothetical protein